MFKLNLVHTKGHIAYLFRLSEAFLFDDGMIHTMNESKIIYARLELPELEMKEPTYCDMRGLKDFMSSSTVSEILLDPEKGRMEVRTPIKTKEDMGIIYDEEEIDSINSLSKLSDTLKKRASKGKTTYKNAFTGELDPLVHFPVDCEQIHDFLSLAGAPEKKINISTGKSMTISSEKRSMIYPKVSTKKNTEILLSQYNTGHFHKALSGTGEAEIYIAHPIMVMIHRDPLTAFFAGMSEEAPKTEE